MCARPQFWAAVGSPGLDERLPLDERRRRERRLGERRREPRCKRERRLGERRSEVRELAARVRQRLLIYPDDIRSARTALLLVAVAVINLDLTHKSLAQTRLDAYHVRSGRDVVVMVGISLLSLFVFPRAGSRPIALGGGLMVGGGIANVLSVAIFGRGIPNPFFVQGPDWTFAFNLADVCVALGFLILLPSVLVFAVLHRHELARALDELVG